jgi:putative ABC transport system substrate-binding protein
MQRRQFIAGLGSAAAWPVWARAQQAARVRRVAVFVTYPESDALIQARLQTFKNALQALGWAEGGNLRVDARFAANARDRVPP